MAGILAPIGAAVAAAALLMMVSTVGVRCYQTSRKARNHPPTLVEVRSFSRASEPAGELRRNEAELTITHSMDRDMERRPLSERVDEEGDEHTESGLKTAPDVV